MLYLMEKNLCLDKANQTGVRHARLPIGKYLTGMQSRKVLTVNQVISAFHHRLYLHMEVNVFNCVGV